MKVAVNAATDIPVDARVLKKKCLQVLRAEGARGDAIVSITAVAEPEMEDLNRRFLGREGPTDVLAFPMDEEAEEGYLLGDVVICPAYVASKSVEYGVGEGMELGFVAAHGVLHLLGYRDDDEEGALEMDRRQREVLGLAEGEGR